MTPKNKLKENSYTDYTPPPGKKIGAFDKTMSTFDTTLQKVNWKNVKYFKKLTSSQTEEQLQPLVRKKSVITSDEEKIINKQIGKFNEMKQILHGMILRVEKKQDGKAGKTH